MEATATSAEDCRLALVFARAEYRANPTPKWARQIVVREARYASALRLLGVSSSAYSVGGRG